MSLNKLKTLVVGAFAFTAMACSSAQAVTTINVAVAANFSNTMASLVATFKALNAGTNVTYTIDSSANLQTAIINHTTIYDLFLSADLARPQNLATNFPTLVVGSPFLYSVGSLELWSPTVNISTGLPSPLTANIVVADPTKAPYGAAAAQVLASSPWLITTIPSTHVFTSPNIGTIYSAIKAGTYPYGFVAQSYICTQKNGVQTFASGFHHSYLYNDASHPYSRIMQYAIKVANAGRTAAQDTVLTNFVNFLRGVGSTTGTSIIQSSCYQLS